METNNLAKEILTQFKEKNKNVQFYLKKEELLQMLFKIINSVCGTDIECDDCDIVIDEEDSSVALSGLETLSEEDFKKVSDNFINPQEEYEIVSEIISYVFGIYSSVYYDADSNEYELSISLEDYKSILNL